MSLGARFEQSGLRNGKPGDAGYMSIPRDVALVGAVGLMNLVPAQIDYRPAAWRWWSMRIG